MKQVLRWGMVLFCALSILYLSLMNASKVPPLQISGVDKIGHAIAYGVLTATVLYAILLYDYRSYVPLICCGLVILYGILIEFLQKTMTESRNFDIFDMLANITGTLIVFFVFSKMINKKTVNT